MYRKGGGVEVDHEMNDNNNAYQKKAGEKKIKTRMARIRMWKTRAVAPAYSVDVGGVGDTGNLSEDYQFGITCGAGKTEERTAIPNDRI